MTAIQPGEEVANLRALLEAEVAERKVLEKEIHKLQERLDALFYATPAGLAIIDDSLRYVQVNEALARINGLCVEDHLGRTVEEVVPDIASSVVPALKRVLKTGQPVLDIEISGETAGDPGNPHWWFASFVPMKSWSGKPHGLGAMVIDVTAQKRLESALSESEARYRSLVEEASDAVILFDEQGNIEDVNRRASEVFLYSHDEITSMNVRDLIPTEDLALAPIRFADLLAGKTVRRKRRLRRKDGSLVQVEIIGQMVGRGRMQSVIRTLSDQGGLRAISNNGGSSRPPGEKPYSVANVSLLRELSSALSNAAQIIEMASSQELLPAPGIEQGIDFYEEVSRFEVEMLKRALRQTGGKQKQAASLLGIKQTTLHAMIKRYNIDLSEFES